MKREELKPVIEIEGVKLTVDAINEIFYLQHGFPKRFADECNPELNYSNEDANREIEYLNENIHYLLDKLPGETEEKEKESIMDVLTTLNRYKKLLDKLKSPEKKS